MLVRDLPMSGHAIYLQIPRRQFYCPHCQRYFTERLSFMDWERRYTQRYECAVYERVKATTINQVSREEGLSWDQVKGIFDHKFRQEKKTGDVLSASV